MFRKRFGLRRRRGTSTSCPSPVHVLGPELESSMEWRTVEYRSNSLDQLAPPPNSQHSQSHRLEWSVEASPSSWQLLSRPQLGLTSPLHWQWISIVSGRNAELVILLIDIDQIKSISCYILIDYNLVTWLLMFLYEASAWFMIWFSIFILWGHFGYSCHYFNVMPISFVCQSLYRRYYSSHSV